MKYYPFFRIFTALMVLAVSLFSLVSTVEAKGFATVGTTLTIDPPLAVAAGSPAYVVAHLISSKGEPVVNQRVELFINGVRERSARTDRNGTVSIRVRRDEAGTYALNVTFKGSKLPSLGSSNATGELIITPALVEIYTTPPLPDIKFSLDGRVFSTDDYGVARIGMIKAGKYDLKLLPLDIKDENIQMQFGRWEDEVFEPDREIEVPMKKPLLIGFEVSYRVRQEFVDLEDKPVDSSRISSITYKGSNGAVFTFEDTAAHWLPAGRVIRLNKGLQEARILYSVMSIVIDGANVVSQAQQRFYVDPEDLWTIQVLLYSARFTARDALFGFPIGTGLLMEYPDGDVQSYAFDTEQGYTIDGLARGIYRVKVTGANGYAPATPIALSRDQDVELMVFSALDIGVLVSVGLFLSVGLLWLGRPYVFKQALAPVLRIVSKKGRGQPPPTPQPQPASKWIAVRSRLFPKRETAGVADRGDET